LNLMFFGKGKSKRKEGKGKGRELVNGAIIQQKRKPLHCSAPDFKT
jgi:hypothetical protein